MQVTRVTQEDQLSRPMRADAARNRERLLAAAVQAFSADADVTLDAIAKTAGVGIGTLYRHFPTREALVDAAYRNELSRLCDTVPELLADLSADKAMRVWMDRFVDYMTTKRDMGAALQAVVAPGGNPFEQSKAKLTTAVATLLAAGASAGVIRSDVATGDLLASLIGVTMAAREDRDMAGRLLDLLLDGLRYQR